MKESLTKIPPLTEEEKDYAEYHVLSTLMWMKGLPSSTNELAVRIENIPLMAN